MFRKSLRTLERVISIPTAPTNHPFSQQQLSDLSRRQKAATRASWVAPMARMNESLRCCTKVGRWTVHQRIASFPRTPFVNREVTSPVSRLPRRLVGRGPSTARRFAILRTGEENTPVRKRTGMAGLEQLDRSDFQRIALQVAGNVHAKVVFLVRRFESFHDLCVSLRIELQELLVLHHDAEATRRTL